jgi:hypothetical protein
MEFIIDSDPIDTPTADPGERPLVPAGIQTLTIRSAEDGFNEYKKCDDNPEGVCLKLRLATEGNHRFVFDDLPMHLGWRAKQLAAAVGIVPVGERLVIRDEELVGQKVSVEITHYTSKAGKVSAVVKRYLPATATPAAPASTPRRTAAQKIVASLPDDDIPFLWLVPLLFTMWGAA